MRSLVVPGKSSRWMVQFPSAEGHYKQTDKQTLERKSQLIILQQEHCYPESSGKLKDKIRYKSTTGSAHEVITTESMDYESRSRLLR